MFVHNEERKTVARAQVVARIEIFDPCQIFYAGHVGRHKSSESHLRKYEAVLQARLEAAKSGEREQEQQLQDGIGTAIAREALRRAGFADNEPNDASGGDMGGDDGGGAVDAGGGVDDVDRGGGERSEASLQQVRLKSVQTGAVLISSGRE